MLLTLTTTHAPATDLGYLLHKHPERPQSLALPFGQAHVFAPEAGEARASYALLLEVDPVALSRRRRGENSGVPLAPYVNDRPYVPGSFLSVALGVAYRSALNGRSQERRGLADTAIPLEIALPVCPARGGPDLPERLFGPLGYAVQAEPILLDASFPEWGASEYVHLRLTAQLRLRDLLAHLYVLLPVLDDEKHYFVSEDEIAKLLRHGEGWLAGHPERELITRRYLKYQRHLTRQASEGFEDDDTEDAPPERRTNLNEQRLDAVLAELRASGASRVLDLGCGEGNLLLRLAAEGQFTAILGLDASARSLARARERLERLPEGQRVRVALAHGGLTYRDARLRGWGAAALVEVIEHLDPPRLGALETSVFGDARPGSVIVTTPNAEYNAVWNDLGRRHSDHRFEWTRAEFQTWAGQVAEVHGYTVRFKPVGETHPDHGPPTQLAVFERAGET